MDILADLSVLTNQDGFIIEFTRWNPDVAKQLAIQEGIALTPAHWEILLVLREFYAQFELSPAMRALIKYLRTSLPDRADAIANSQHLMTLFGGSPAKTAARLAGLPKPPHCL